MDIMLTANLTIYNECRTLTMTLKPQFECENAFSPVATADHLKNLFIHVFVTFETFQQ